MCMQPRNTNNFINLFLVAIRNGITKTRLTQEIITTKVRYTKNRVKTSNALIIIVSQAFPHSQFKCLVLAKHSENLKITMNAAIVYNLILSHYLKLYHSCF